MSVHEGNSNHGWNVAFTKLPTSLGELQSLREAKLDKPYYAAGLLIPSLSLWSENKEEAIRMINFLRGPQPLSPYEIQFISERLRGNDYIPRSYFGGARPENGYQPQDPFTVTISSVPSSFEEEGYARLYLQSGGADSPRPVNLRRKGSTNQWFLTDQMLLAQIRKPVAEDPWA